MLLWEEVCDTLLDENPSELRDFVQDSTFTNTLYCEAPDKIRMLSVDVKKGKVDGLEIEQEIYSLKLRNVITETYSIYHIAFATVSGASEAIQ